MTLSYSVAIVITRHRRDISMTPAICLSQLLLVLAAGAFAQPTTIGQHDLVFLVLMGVGQMGLGLVLFAMGARLIVASEIALITLLEVVLGPFWAWVAVSEKPPLMTVVGGAVVVAAVLIQTTGTGLSRRRANARRRGSLPGPAASPARDPSGTGSGARRRRRE
jgi:drug/metabolite transporter (DMT)-like permease